MNQKQKVAAYDFLRARLLVSQINGSHIVPGAPLNKCDTTPESYREKVDEAILKELEK